MTQTQRWSLSRARSSCPEKKRLIERAYQLAEACGIPLWNQDEAGPYATRPQPGASWQREGHPNLQPHEYLRDGGAKRMTLLHPATGEVRAKGVISVTNAVFHPWLQEQLLSILECEEKARNQEGHQLAPLARTEVGQPSASNGRPGLAGGSVIALLLCA